MAYKFHGTKDEFKSQIHSLESRAQIDETEKNKIKVTFVNGLILNYFLSTKTLQFQGTPDDLFKEKIIIHLPASKQNTSVAIAKNDAKELIFIVHGHDEESKKDLEYILMK